MNKYPCNTTLLVSGYNKYNQLIGGSNNDTKIAQPQIVNLGKGIRSFSTYSHSSVLIDANGKAYGIGKDIDSRIGTPMRKIYETFTEIKLENVNENFISAHCGAIFTVYITESYHLVVCCKNDKNLKPKILKLEARPVSLFGGCSSCSIIDENGDIIVITCANNKKFCPIIDIHKIHPSIYIKSMPYIVACGCHKIYILTKDHRVFETEYHNNPEKYEEVKIITRNKNSKIIDISGTAYNFFAIDSDGFVYYHGTYDKYNYFEKPEYLSNFAIIDKLVNYKISKAFSGIGHTIFFTTNGKVMTCGWNAFGQLMNKECTSDISSSLYNIDIGKNKAAFSIAGKAISAIFLNSVPSNNPNQINSLILNSSFNTIPAINSSPKIHTGTRSKNVDNTKPSPSNLSPKVPASPQPKNMDNTKPSPFNLSPKVPASPQPKDVDNNKPTPFNLSPKVPVSPQPKNADNTKPSPSNLSLKVPVSPQPKIADNIKPPSANLSPRIHADPKSKKVNNTSPSSVNSSQKTQEKHHLENDSQNLKSKLEIINNENNSLKNQLQKINKENNELKDKLNKINEECNYLKDQNTKKNIQIKELDKANKELKQNINDLSSKLKKTNEEYNVLHTQGKNQINKLEEEKELLKKQNEEIKNLIKKLEDETNKLNKQKDDIKIKLNNNIAENQSLKFENNFLIDILHKKNKIKTLYTNNFIEEEYISGVEHIKYLSKKTNVDVAIVEKTFPIKDKYIMKVFKTENFDEFKKFFREFDISSLLNHKCIVKFIKFYYPNQKGKYPSLLVEYLPNNLKEIIKNHNIKLTNTRKVIIILEILYGLRYMHNRKIMHRNIKPENILITKKYHAKIGDFSWANLIDDDINYSQKDKTSIAYVAPELINDEPYDNKVDLFSFGKVMYFILSGKKPPFDMNEIKNGITYKKLSCFTDLSSKIMSECCNISPKQRPTFDQIIKTIEDDNYGLLPNINIKEIRERITKLNIYERINSSNHDLF